MIRAFGVIALLAVSLQAVILVTLHVLPTKYDSVLDAISDYGAGGYRGYFWAQLVAGGSACIGLRSRWDRSTPTFRHSPW